MRVGPLMIALAGVTACACSPEVAGETGAPALADTPNSAAPASSESPVSSVPPVASAPRVTSSSDLEVREPSAPVASAPASVPTSSPSATDAPTTVAPAVPRTFTLAVTGDMLTHSPLWRQAAENAAAAGASGFDFDPMLAGLAPVVANVDVGICHLETPIAPFGESLSTMPRYGVPAEVVDAIVAAGYDRCSTASNHTADRGSTGIDRTVEVLHDRGLGQSGMARTPEEIEPSVFLVGDVGVAHLSYTWSYNGLSLPDGEEWRSALIHPWRIVADATLARERGAEVVLISLHWGAEGITEPTRYQRTIADEITASGVIDLVIGHHAHVVQPIEQVNGTWVLFGLGNILSNLPTSDRWPAATQDGMVVTAAITVTPDGEVVLDRPQVHPTWVDKDNGWVVHLVADELARSDLDAAQRARLQASWDRTASVVGEYLAAPT